MYFQIVSKSTGSVLITAPTVEDARSFMSLYSIEDQKDMEIKTILKEEHPLIGGRR